MEQAASAAAPRWGCPLWLQRHSAVPASPDLGRTAADCGRRERMSLHCLQRLQRLQMRHQQSGQPAGVTRVESCQPLSRLLQVEWQCHLPTQRQLHSQQQQQGQCEASRGFAERHSQPQDQLQWRRRQRRAAAMTAAARHCCRSRGSARQELCGRRQPTAGAGAAVRQAAQSQPTVSQQLGRRAAAWPAACAKSLELSRVHRRSEPLAVR